MLQEVSQTFTGDATSYIGTRIRGEIIAIKVVADSSVTNSWDLTLTGETTAVPILTDITVANNATTWFYPVVLSQDNSDGTDTASAYQRVWVFLERIKCVSANADAGDITVTVYYDSKD